MAPPPSLPHAHPGCMNRPMQKLPHVTPPPRPKEKVSCPPFPPTLPLPTEIKVSFSFKSFILLVCREGLLKGALGADLRAGSLTAGVVLKWQGHAL